MDSEPSNHVPAIYVAKYNRFVDNILGRINKILRTNYDPVTVKLTNPNSSSKVSKNKSKNKSKRKSNKKGSKRTAVESTSVTVEKLNQGNSETVEKIMESTDNMNVSATPMEQVPTTSEMVESRSSTDVTKTGNRQKAGTNKKSNKNRNGSKNKTKTQTGTNNKNKKKSRSKPKARATLYGLATLQRSGNVSVNMMSDHTTIKTKFTLGPLVLKVEKEFGRAAKRELRSATATTAEMSGKLSLRVLHGGAATLNSIRVLQPKQVRVESADDHDRTREFVWKRSSHIAHLVSQKLSSATRSMLQPPPEVANAA